MDHISQDNVISLAGVDWQQAWEYEDSRRVRPADASHWSGRAKSYGEHSLGEYERTFIERAQIKPGQTVLDFGCGIGLLAIPLAKMGCEVIACDFSEGMLAMLRENARVAGVSDLIDVRLLAWDDDWQAAGI